MIRKFKAIYFVLVVSLLVRFLSLPKLLTFTPDEEYLIYIANTLIKHFHIIWIGVSSLGFDLYMGPFWIYIISAFLLLSKGDPIILGYLASFLGVITTGVVYFIGKKFFSEKVGIISSILYATSALVVYNDQKSYPTGVALLSTLMALSIFMTKYSKRWWILFALFYGLVFHIHLSLILMIFVALYWVALHRKSIDKKTFALSVFAFLLIVSPLIAFDYFHKGSNITVPIRIIKSVLDGKSKSTLNLIPRITILSGSLSRILYLPLGKEATDEVLFPCYLNVYSTRSKPVVSLSLLVASILVFFIVSKKSWGNENKKLLILISLSFIIPFIFLPIINPVEYYLQGFFPFLLLIIAITVESLNKTGKFFGYFAVAVLVLHGISTVYTAKGDFGLNSKKNIISSVMNKIGTSSFSIDEEGGCQRYAGWRYLFEAYGRRPEKANEDKTFSWLYPNEVSNDPIEFSVILNEKRVPISIDPHFKYLIEVGGFQAYIYENNVSR